MAITSQCSQDILSLIIKIQMNNINLTQKDNQGDWSIYGKNRYIDMIPSLKQACFV